MKVPHQFSDGLVPSIIRSCQHTSDDLAAGALLTGVEISAEDASTLAAWRFVFDAVLPPAGIPNRPLLFAVASARLLEVGINRAHKALNHSPLNFILSE